MDGMRIVKVKSIINIMYTMGRMSECSLSMSAEYKYIAAAIRSQYLIMLQQFPASFFRKILKYKKSIKPRMVNEWTVMYYYRPWSTTNSKFRSN